MDEKLIWQQNRHFFQGFYKQKAVPIKELPIYNLTISLPASLPNSLY